MLVDSHCHLDFPELYAELDQVVARARAAGVGRMVTISTKVSEFDRVRSIAERYPDVYCSVGIHPHEAGSEPAVDAERLAKLAEHPKVVGIGETGLDFFYEHSPRDAQRRSFEVHIEAARMTGLPLIVHSRDADAETAEILAEGQARGRFGCLLHCFSSGRQLAERAVDLGMYISLAGIVTFKNAGDLRETVRAVPLDRLLVETDAPYLTPVPLRGKRNEPAFVVHTAQQVAGLKGLGSAEFAQISTENFFRIFARVPKSG